MEFAYNAKMADTKQIIREIGKQIGFDVVAFTRASIGENAKAGLAEYLALGHHGDMKWLEDNFDRRTEIDELWNDAKSVIVLGHNYAPSYNPLHKLKHKNIGNISAYAGGDDYHDIIKKMLKQFAGMLVERFGCEVKIFVDTAPVMEKPLAAQAGIGWQGKHTCIVSREFGNWLFLSEIFVSMAIEPDKPASDHCGTCTKCIDICSTAAIIAPGKLDARKCITYLTIEHKGHIDKQYRKAIGNRIYGCDDCLAVCPWNSFAKRASEIAYQTRQELVAPLLSELVLLDDAGFRKMFAKSPIKRIKRDRFIRNVLIAIGNSEDKSLLNVITPLLEDGSPLVRAATIWAVRELASEQEYEDLKNLYLGKEIDSEVQKEWE